MLRSDVAAVPRLKGVLAGHGYLAQALPDPGRAPGRADQRLDLPLHLRRLASPAPLPVLLRLFGLGVPVPEEQARAALAPLTLGELEEAGLLRLGQGLAEATTGLSVYEGLLLAHDAAGPGQPLARDHVLGVNPTSITLAQLTPRLPVASALDLGCGNGVQALLLARHAARVTGTDANPRALAFARFNARLNGVENVEWLEGDLFAPVAGRRFDLVVSNPPYVISPEDRFTFRDGGRRGDHLSEEVVVQAAAHLAEGGHATILCNWALALGEDPAAPPRRWVEGRGCDALVLLRGAQDALEYAAAWNRSGDRVAYQAALDRWTAHFEELGIAAVGLGTVVLRRRGGARNFFQVEELPEAARGPAGAQLAAMLDAQAVLQGPGADQALLGTRYRLEAGCRVEQHLAPGDGDLQVVATLLRQPSGLRLEGSLDASALELLRLCDGRRTLGDAVGELCGRRGGPDGASVLEVARRLVALGFLVRAPRESVHGR